MSLSTRLALAWNPTTATPSSPPFNRLSLVATLGMLALSLLFSLALRPLTGMPFDALFLALSPGGLTGISLVALAMGIDPAFVTAHNVLRVLLILLAGPLVFRVAHRRAGSGNKVE